jgi:hypothetical protein
MVNKTRRHENRCCWLAAAGISSELTRLLTGFQQGTWLSGAGAGLPVQVVHGDVAASNMLADERSVRLHELSARTSGSRAGRQCAVKPSGDRHGAFTLWRPAARTLAVVVTTSHNQRPT